MTREQIINELAGSMRAAFIGIQPGGAELTYDAMARILADKLDSMKVLVCAEVETDPIELSPAMRFAEIEMGEPFRMPDPAPQPFYDDNDDDDDDHGPVAENINNPAPITDEDIRNMWISLRGTMVANGIESIMVQMSGGGDSGQVDEISFEPDTGLERQASIFVPDDAPTPASLYRPAGEERGVPIREYVEGLYWDLCDHAGHGGWYNDTGGHGDITFSANGRISWNHYDTIEESDRSSYAWTLSPENPHA